MTDQVYMDEDVCARTCVDMYVYPGVRVHRSMSISISMSAYLSIYLSIYVYKIDRLDRKKERRIDR